MILAFVFVILYKGDVALGYINQKQGVNEYIFYNNTKESIEKDPNSGKEIQKQVITDGEKLSDPGHVFKDSSKVLEKWQDENGNEIKFDTPISVTGNEKKTIKVYPVFKNQVVITYYIVGSTNDRVYMTDTITDASSYKLPVDPTIYDANKYFVNWSTSKDGKSGVYDEESLKKDIAAGKTDIKLYAITEFKHKATFITGDDASYQDQILADDGSHLEKMPENPTRPGYEFSHWSLTEDGDPVDLKNLELSEDIDVYAVWKPVVVDYKFKVMVQNINDDGYTFHEIISARGLNGEKTSLPFKGSENPDPKLAPTGPIVEDIKSLTEKDGRFSDGYNSKDENGKMDHTYTNPQTLDYPGFHLNEEKTKKAFETIEADGSTVVPVYMDRNVHTIWVYKNTSAISYYQANWVKATDNNGNIHVDLRYGQSSETWFAKLDQDYIYYMDKRIESFYTRAPAMGDKDIYMYRVLAKGTKYQLRFVEWDPNKFNANINRSDLATLKNTLGTMKEIGKRVSFQNSEWYMNWNGRKYRVFEPYQNNYQQVTYSWVDKTDHVDDIEGFQPKKGEMSQDGLQSINVNNPAFRDYMFAAGKGLGGYKNYTGTPYKDDDGSYVGFLFYERKTYHINYYSGSKRLASNPYKYEADTSDFGLGYEKGVTTNPNNPNQVFMGWYEDSTFSVEHKHEAGAKMPAHDITVYAKWDSRQYEVTFHTNQDNYESDIEKISEIPEDDTLYDGKYKDEKVSEENFPKPIQPKDATEFLGWYEKNKNGRFVKANLHKPIKNNDTHLYAKWKYAYLELKYDLNLEASDKVEGTAPTDSNSYINDAKALAADVGNVKVNGGKKVFVGWSESKDGSSGIILPSETVLMDKNKTLYAQWKEFPEQKTTKVIYDANGGVGDQYVVKEIVTNDTHTVLGNGEGEKINFTREGYVFKGWNTDKNATEAKFKKDDEVYVNSDKEDTDNYIYAIWAPIINYTTDGHGQAKEGENFVDKTNEEVELKSNPKGTETKANEGYKFSHWTADKNIKLSDGTEIKAGEEITEEQLKQAVITEPLTFKANFVKDAPKEFNVTHEFKVAEDSPVKEMPADVKTAVDAQLPADKTAKDGETVTPTEPEKTKVADKENDGTWTFEGYKDQNPDTEAVDAKVNGKDIKFEGEWKFTPNEHKVTYEYVSGTEGKELPEALKAKAPKDVTGKVKGEKVTSPVPTGKDAEYRDETNKGTWKFKSYDKDSVTISNQDEKVTGTWEFTPKEDPQPETGSVYVKYVTEDGKVLEKESEVKVNAEVGTKYTTEQKTFEGYEFVKMDDNSAPANGEVKKGDQHVTYVYKKTEVTPPVEETGNVYVKYVAEDGTVLEKESTVKKDAKVGEAYTTEQKTFDGYEFVKMDDNSAPANGEVKKGGRHVTYVYKKKEVTPPVGETGNVYVKYVTEDGEVLEAESTVKKDAKVGEAYTTEEKTFDGYEFVKLEDGSAPANGEVKKGDQHVTYVYKKKEVTPPVGETGNVYVKYVTEDGEVLEAESTVKKDAKVGEAYTTEQKTFDGYEFVRMADDSADANGTVKKGDQTVTYVYKKKEKPVEQKGSVYVRYIAEDGTVLEGYTPVKKDVPVGEHYTTEQKAFNGYVFKGMLADSAGANGNVVKGDLYVTYVYKQVKDPVVDPDGKTGNVYVNYVTVDGTALTPQKTVKQDAPVGEAYTTEQKTFNGYEFVKMGNGSADANGNVLEGNQYVTYVYKPIETPQAKTGNVYVKYITEDGKVLEAEKSVVTNAKVGTEYKTELKSFDDYEFVKMADGSADANGQVVEGDLHVVYVYRKKSTPKPPTPSTETGNVFVKYITEDGKVLYEGIVKKDAKIGEKYTTQEKEFEGYEFVRMDKNSAAKNGSVTKEDQTVVYVYKKKGNTTTPTVDKITKSVDENGKEISNSTKGDNPKKDIDGYEFVRTETDKNGNTVHIYKKKENSPTPTVDKITKFVDENGNVIASSQNGKVPEKDIDGYEFVKTETDKDGNTVHIYKKKETPTVDKITKFVDEKGNEISKSTKGDNPKKDIDGYEFVKTETDKDGNTVHIYKKKENTKKPGVSTGETSKPNKDNKPNTSTGTVSPGKTTVVPGSTSINQANKTVRGNVRTGVGSSIGALVTLAGSALALFKSKIRK